MVYCLLPRKTRETCERVFTITKEKAEELGLDFSPECLMSDFELSIIRAVQLSFPTADAKGCYFHFFQSLIRKLQSLGLQAVYREDRELSSFVRRTAALAFVPARYVRFAWQAVKAEAPQLAGVAEFKCYFETEWLVDNSVSCRNVECVRQ